MVAARRLGLALWLAACQRPAVTPEAVSGPEPVSASAPAPTPAAHPPTARIEVREGPGAPAQSFGLFAADTLRIEVVWSGRAPADRGLQILDVYSPDGVVYRSESAAPRSPLRIELPVAGTRITRYGLAGRWSAELRFERGGAAVAVTEFDLVAEPTTAE